MPWLTSPRFEKLNLYGRSSELTDLDDRRDDYTGAGAHRQAVAEQEEIIAQTENPPPDHPDL